MATVASDILSDRPEYSECHVEEFHEAYVPAESSQEGQNARLPQAHEHGRRAEDHRCPEAARTETAGRLIVVKEQANTTDRLSGV
jgi:hypothetical protein